MLPLVNFIAFQAGWFGCVLNAAAGRPWTAAAIALAAATMLAWQHRGAGGALKLLAVAVALGALCDGSFVMGSLLHYPAGDWAPPLPPAWDLALWALFASTLHSVPGWLKARSAIAALLGAAGGPLAYAGAAHLGALQLKDPSSTLVLLGGAWAIMTPLLLIVARRLDKRPARAGEIASPRHV